MDTLKVAGPRLYLFLAIFSRVFFSARFLAGMTCNIHIGSIIPSLSAAAQDKTIIQQTSAKEISGDLTGKQEIGEPFWAEAISSIERAFSHTRIQPARSKIYVSCS